jgi:WD40 repeat protein
LAVSYAANDVADAPALNVLASFRLPAASTALSTAQLDNNSVALVVAAADGSLSRLRLQIPTIPGSHPESIQLREEDFDDDYLVSWCPSVHLGPATAIAMDSKGNVLSTGADGRICLKQIDNEVQSNTSELHNSHGGITYTQVQWTTPHTFATTSLQGVVHSWDTRTPTSPVQSLSDSPSRSLASLLSLQAHPAQPHVLATGNEHGVVAFWDLRRQGQCVTKVHAEGAITSLAYDTIKTGAGDRILIGTSKGIVGAASAIPGSMLSAIYRESAGAAIEGLCLSTAGAANQIFASTDQEVLLFMANTVGDAGSFN